MNGAEALLQTAAASGVRVCFANPGTTELALVTALNQISGIRGILGLFEGVCTGAADGFGRMSEQPALTILHLGPGLSNGMANLHNARRAQSRVINLVGEHATWHLPADAPLTSDLDSLARVVSRFVRRPLTADAMAQDMASALTAVQRAGGAVATLILPTDCQISEASGPANPISNIVPPLPAARHMESMIEELKLARSSALLLGGSALSFKGLVAATRIAASTGAHLFSETFSARLERGQGIPSVERLPYFPEKAQASLSKFQSLFLFGARSPVSFFGYPDMPSSLVPEGCVVHEVVNPEEDVALALSVMAEEFSGKVRHAPRPDVIPPTGSINPLKFAHAIACAQPEGGIVVDESSTTGGPYGPLATSAPPHSILHLTGGSIGQGLPVAIGASVACPDRPVIALQADGGAMYTLQALWTQAREDLNITTIICSNRAYNILRIELHRAGVSNLDGYNESFTDLSNPEIDWVKISEGMGIPGQRVELAEDLSKAVRRSIAESGPHLIEAVL